jgi:hypothetical protein
MGTNFVDQYSLLHFATGIIAYFFNIRLPTWIFLHFLFEYSENTDTGIFIINKYFKNIWPGGKNYSDTLTNSLGDTLFAVLGWIMSYYLDELGNKYKLFDKHIK